MDISPWFVLLLGMGTVFTGLVLIILLTKLMSSFFTGKKPTAAAAAPAPAAPQAQAAPQPILNRPQFDAAIAAAIAAYTGTTANGLRIHSIKQLTAGGDANNDRGQLTAAVAAAIATATNTEANGLKIHSIKRI